MAETRISGGRHQRCSAEEWRDIFERRAASGLSIATFCQREGIAKSSYERWRTQLAHAARDAGTALLRTGVGFVDTGVLAHRATPETSERLDLTLELGHGIVLHVVRG
jgi:transposase-like protein